MRNLRVPTGSVLAQWTDEIGNAMFLVRGTSFWVNVGLGALNMS